jgi:hypothetical protein
MAEWSPLEEAAIDYCCPRGIPLTLFTEQRVVLPGEPQWTVRDVEAALWWQARQSRRCECGHNLDDTLGEGEAYKWNAEKTGQCDVCRALDLAATVIRGGDDLNPLAGARFKVWRDEEAN